MIRCCTKCGLSKPLSEFPTVAMRRRRKFGRMVEGKWYRRKCKTCCYSEWNDTTKRRKKANGLTTTKHAY